MTLESVPAAAELCDHYWAWVSPAGTARSARICMACHQPDPEWLNHTVEVNLGHPLPCVHCEFAPSPDDITDAGGECCHSGRCEICRPDLHPDYAAALKSKANPSSGGRASHE